MRDTTDPIPALKQQVASHISEEVRGMPQGFGAYRIGTSQARLSNICNAKLDRFSLEQLIRMVTRLNRRVTIEIAETRRTPRHHSRASRRPDDAYDGS